MVFRRAPDHVRINLPERAQAGTGLTFTYLTDIETGSCEANQLLQGPPCKEAIIFARNIIEWLNKHGATHARPYTDLRGYGHTGIVTIIWSDGPSALDTATHFSVATAGETPQLPAWIGLKNETDFDLRWQIPY